MEKPLVSIITVVYNAQSTLQATIESVLNQDRDLVEYWIIDGGSTDGSLDIIRQYSDKLAGWISEPDKGIYDAMNKGIDRANGRWLYFLGADDQLRPNIVDSVTAYMNDMYAIVFGSVVFNTGQRMQSYMGLLTLFQNTLHHQSAFYHHSLFDEFRYDSNLRTLADYELNLLVYIRKMSVRLVPFEVALCYIGGASSDWNLTVKETNMVRQRHLRPTFMQPVLSGLLRLYYAQKMFRQWLCQR